MQSTAATASLNLAVVVTFAAVLTAVSVRVFARTAVV